LKERLELATGITVAAWDPGATTGHFVYRTWYKQKEPDIASKAWPQEELLRAAANDTDHFDYLVADVWIIESFRLYPHKAQAMSLDALLPVKVIGYLEVLARRLEIPKIVYQSAAEAKGLVDNERLKAYGWKLPTDHEKDAARHAIYFLSKLYQQQIKEDRHARKRDSD
jgi:hypothetical protein